MDINEALRDGVIDVARRAATEILAVYDGDFAVQHKGDDSPLTAADLAAHRCITAGLAALTPGVPVLSEESSDVDIALRRQWRRFWLVDPLDGTREFIKRNGEFTVNIALVEDGVAVFGVIQQPVTDGLWHGTLGQGAYRREGDHDIAIRTRMPATAPLTVAASRSARRVPPQLRVNAARVRRPMLRLRRPQVPPDWTKARQRTWRAQHVEA